MKKHAYVCDENLSIIDMMNEYPNENEKKMIMVKEERNMIYCTYVIYNKINSLWK